MGHDKPALCEILIISPAFFSYDFSEPENRSYQV